MTPEPMETYADHSVPRCNGTPLADEDRSPALDGERLLDLVRYEYRSLVVRRLQVTAEWRVLEWVEAAACTGQQTATRAVCDDCPVKSECLAAALATDDRAEWRGGLNLADRQHIWKGLERTYREVRDFELLRLDADRLMGGER